MDTAVNREAYSKNYARKIILAVFGKSENEKKAPMKQRHTWVCWDLTVTLLQLCFLHQKKINKLWSSLREEKVHWCLSSSQELFSSQVTGASSSFLTFLCHHKKKKLLHIWCNKKASPCMRLPLISINYIHFMWFIWGYDSINYLDM